MKGIPSSLVAAGGASFSDLRTSRAGLFWCESRPLENGRQAIMWMNQEGTVREAIPSSHVAGNKIHGYGGGCFALDGFTLFYSNIGDGTVYRIDLSGGGPPEVLITGGSAWYGDFSFDPVHRLLLAVRETRTSSPENSIVSIDGEGRVTTLAQRSDFYLSPRVSPSGRYLAWLQWNQPGMPWEAAGLHVQEFHPGSLHEPSSVFGGSGKPVLAFCFTRDDACVFVGERGDWWNLHEWTESGVRVLVEEDAEHAFPQWNLGLQPMCETRHGLLFVSNRDARVEWKLLDRDTLGVAAVDLPFSSGGGQNAWYGGRAYTIAGSETRLRSVVGFDPLTGEHGTVRESLPARDLDAVHLPTLEHATFAARDGGSIHAVLSACPVPNSPLLIRMHGGPTDQTLMELDLRTAYWAGLGYTVCLVNYRGSTGYGGHYRRALLGTWGVIDVADCCDVARALIGNGTADPKRTYISGGSSGGLTVLNSLIEEPAFSAGASYFGVADLELLLEDCHKFEAEYLVSLIAPRTDLATYRQRSPIAHATDLTTPVIFFHGLKDMVVPVAQTERMSAALRERRVPVSVVTYPGEGHGFRGAKAISYSLDAEAAFYEAVSGGSVPPLDPPLAIENLPAIREAGHHGG